jgi:hypothetical protein
MMTRVGVGAKIRNPELHDLRFWHERNENEKKRFTVLNLSQ